MTPRWRELRCTCGPSRRGPLLLRYRASAFTPTPDGSGEPADLEIKCRFCKRLHTLAGVHSLDDLRTNQHWPLSRIGRALTDTAAM
jgi:hypothetical protein